MNRLAFLDRDGVLVKAIPDGNKTRGPRSVDELEYLPDAVDGCKRLFDMGYWLICVTNQPDVARGLIAVDLHHYFQMSVGERFQVWKMYSCTHDDQDNCCCRKPKPGMIYAAAYQNNGDLSHSVLFGDRATDIHAARAAGVTGYLMPTNSSLLEAVKCALANQT